MTAAVVYMAAGVLHLPGPNPGTPYTLCIVDAGAMQRLERTGEWQGSWCSECLAAQQQQHGSTDVTVPGDYPDPTSEQADRTLAAISLARRSGASSVYVGFVRSGVPAGEEGWYARADFDGYAVQYPARSSDVFGVPGPVEAAEGMARVVMDDGTCRRCGRTVHLAGEGAAPAGTCVWAREGSVYVPGCGQEVDNAMPLPPNLAHAGKPWWWLL